MTAPADRVGELLEETKRERRELVTPEGTVLHVQLASLPERISAFVIDAGIMLAITAAAALAAVFTVSAENAGAVTVSVLFIAFLIRIGYFTFCDLSSRGRTPGKAMCGLWIISRYGGELPPAAVIARNLTRELEFFLPLSLLIALDASRESWRLAGCLVWIAVISSLPLWNRDRLRLGDLIAGTLVIALPKRMLSSDIASGVYARSAARYTFTAGQLSVYGAYELQVLEELLRQSRHPKMEKNLAAACGKICRKIGWKEDVPPAAAQQFLTDFYTAQRAVLERGQLFGKFRADKNSAAGKKPGRQR